MPKKFRFTNKTKEMIQQNKVTTLKITRILKTLMYELEKIFKFLEHLSQKMNTKR